MKRMIILILSVSIAFCPCLTLCDFSYAEEETETDTNWLFLVDAEHEIQDTLFVSAFKAYLNSNKTYMNFSYPYEKAIVNWTYDNINQICSDAGLGTIEEYYDQVAVAVDNDGNFKFWYKASGIQFMDSLFKAYLQHYGILTDNETKNIFSGEYFKDDDGFGCYVSYSLATSGTTQIRPENFSQYVSQLGSMYRFNYNYFNATTTGNAIYNLNYNNHLIQYTLTNETVHNNSPSFDTNTTTLQGGNYILWERTNDTIVTNNGYLTIFKSLNQAWHYNEYYLGTYIDYNSFGTHYYGYSLAVPLTYDSESFVQQAIYLAKKGADNANLALANNALLNVGKMGADIGVAAVNYIEDQNEDEPEVETPEEPPSVNPPVTIPTYPTGVTQDPNGGFNFQMPDINIDWSLNLDVNNLPFPFSIPHDIYNAFNSLNVEAEAPHFEGTVDLYVCEWDIDIDFSDYSSLANIVNKWFLFVYVVGLIIATRSLMHIY